MQTANTIADFCEALRSRDSDALGYVPAVAYHDALTRGRLELETENDEPCGFAFWGRRKNLVRIYQCVIAHDARRVLHATRLVARTLALPGARGATELALRVATDLPANEFWQSIGCRVIGTQRGGKRRHRTINLYRLSLANPKRLAQRMIAANISAATRAIDTTAADRT